MSTAAILLGTGRFGTGRAVAAPSKLPYPFKVGVASGDPLPDSVVLWTRLAPDPLALDGLGGMPDKAVQVHYQVAEDEAFTRIVDHGSAAASRELAHSVHINAKNLRPRREYFYRFKAGNEISPVGRTRTAPSARDRLRRMKVAVTSCQHYEEAYFSAYRYLAQDDPDLVAHCGDYIYESPSGLAFQPRQHAIEPEPEDLAGYRVRHSQYKTDPDLQAAHRLVPWVFTYDDHDVDNNWAGPYSEFYPDVTVEQFLARRSKAFQAYYEHLPLRPERRPDGPDIPLHRRVRFGDLATFHVLDGRQFRDRQLPCTDPEQCPGRDDPDRTMLGPEQEKWLLDGLRGSRSRWNFLVQQVPFTQLDEKEGPGFQFGKDNWNYFPAARQRIVDEFARNPGLNGVIVGGEIHRHLAAAIKPSYADPDTPAVATELIASSVASGGNGNPNSAWVAKILAENPHIPYAREQRGYLRCDITRDGVTADFRVVPEAATNPDSPVVTDASFTIEAGRPGPQR